MAGRVAPEERCGFTYDVSTLSDLGPATCWRPVWEDRDRCVWHAREERKPRAVVEAAAPDGPERLDGAFLSGIDLAGVEWFRECTLPGADFEAVDLRNASLAGTDLREASLEAVDLRKATLAGSNLEDASFSRCDLRNTRVDGARLDQAVFTDARINRQTTFGDAVVYERELEATADGERSRDLAQAAIWSYHEIQALHDENALPFEARHYNLREEDVRRRLAWRSGHYGLALKAEGARWITGYGMSPWRVLATAAFVVVVSAMLYPTTGGLQETISRGATTEPGSTVGNQTTITWSIDDPESTPRYVLVFVFFRSLYFSIVTFTGLGYGDINPVGDFARALAGIEAVLGQLLLALLVFVLAQRIS